MTDLATVTVKSDDVFHNRLGRFHHNDVIGKPWGTKWISDMKKYAHALRPTPELWTRVLPHRTQILYHPDISMISEMLEMRPGSVVVESGTGSGSFSHSMARIIGKTGKLHTFEFHPVRAEKATEEFKAHGLADIITVHHRDVCKNGFDLTDVADCVFLDLPAPWEAIEHAKRALRKDKPTRICCFSPCAEQVQKTCDTLRTLGFYDIKMFEVLVREHTVTKIDLKQDALPEDLKGPSDLPNASNPASILVSRPSDGMRGHTSYLTFASLLPAHTAS